MAISVGDVIKVTAHMKWKADVDILNVYHFRWVSGTTFNSTDVFNALKTWLAAVYDQFGTRITSDVTGYLLKVDKVHWDVGTAKEVVDENGFVLPWTFTNAMTGAGESLPLQDAVCITLRSSRPKSRARKFLPPMVETASSDGGLLEANTQAGAVLAIPALLSDMTTAASNVWRPVIMSGLAPANYHLDLISGTYTTHFCTRRSRRRGVGK